MSEKVICTFQMAVPENRIESRVVERNGKYFIQSRFRYTFKDFEQDWTNETNPAGELAQNLDTVLKAFKEAILSEEAERQKNDANYNRLREP